MRRRIHGKFKNLQQKRRWRERMGTQIYILPNLLTTGNLFFGFMSIIHSIKGNYVFAAYAIVAAAIFDQLDGRVARLTHSTSLFGSEYDSLCDLVSFGMAPSLLMYLWALHPFPRIGYLFAFIYVACGALRLARFNVQKEVESNVFFLGLPIPMAAGLIAGSVMCFEELSWQAQGSPWLLAMTLLVGLFMVSNFPYRSFKEVNFKERFPFHYLVLGVFIFAVVAYYPEVMIFFLFLGYAILGAVTGVLRIGKQPQKNPYFEE